MTERVPEEMVDIHNHLCPGVDDGARTLSESLRYLRALRAEGVTRLATSPHLQGWLVKEPGALEEKLARLEAGFAELRAACDGREDVPELTFSQEILVQTPRIAEAVFRTPGVGLRGTGYALCEFGFDPDGDMREVLRVVLDAGRKPIVAHPERYRLAGPEPHIEVMRGWKEMGALLQVNCGSVLGAYGDGVKKLAWQTLEAGLADLLGTDHHADARPISPRQTARYMAGRGAAEQARLLLLENPRRILDDRDTVAVPPWRAPQAAA